MIFGVYAGVSPVIACHLPSGVAEIPCAGQLTASLRSAASLGVPVRLFSFFLGRVLGS